MAEQKLWGGRFTGKIDPLMEIYNDSLPFDKVMYKEDLEGTRVYTAGLAKIGLLSADELKAVHDGIKVVEEEWANDKFVVKPGDEDIHTANERRLGEVIGKNIAGKVHTGRSRNDQSATDVRLYVRKIVGELEAQVGDLIRVLAARGKKEIDALMPGYTHLQRAQPIRWAHLLSSYATYFTSDLERLVQIRERVNESPLGAGALAGHPYGLDREYVAKELGFNKVIGNSLTAVSDRDYIAEVLFWASLTATHLSKLSEDFIIYCSAEFGFIKLADAYSTGSSLMPQKKNADSLELIRGKSGRIFGNLAGLLMTLKGLPTSYNKDLQEDKEPLFDTLTAISHSVQIATGVVSTLTIDADRMRGALTMDMLATDLADYLVRKGVPFRETHHISGQAVAFAENNGLSGIDKIPLAEYKKIDARFDADVANVFDFEASVERRTATGGTAKSAVLKSLGEMEKRVDELLA